MGRSIAFMHIYGVEASPCGVLFLQPPFAVVFFRIRIIEYSNYQPATIEGRICDCGISHGDDLCHRSRIACAILFSTIGE